MYLYIFLFFDYSHNFNLFLEILEHDGVLRLLSVLLHALCSGMFCELVVTAASVGSDLYCNLKKSH